MIKAIFRYAAASSLAFPQSEGPTPKELFDAFGHLPGNTQITGLTKFVSTNGTDYEFHAENDVLPDGTEVVVKFRVHGLTSQQGSYKFFTVFDGLDFNYPSIPVTPPGPPPAAINVPNVTLPNAPGPSFKIPTFVPISITIDSNASIGALACTCGSEKVGSPAHSSWCDKYSADLGVDNS